MVQRWKEGVALRWLNPASVQHVIALFVAVAICRSASRVSFCMRRAHTSRQVLLLVMRMNKNRNSQQRDILNSRVLSLTLPSAAHLHTACTYCNTSTKHLPPAGDMFTPLVPPVRVAPTVSPCRSSWLGRPLSFSLSLMCSVSGFLGPTPWFEWAILTRASPHTESREAQACSSLCGSSMASRISSAAFTSRCSRRFSVCKGRRVLSVALRAPLLVFPLSFPFQLRLDWYALDLATVKITLVTHFVPSKRTRRWAFRKVNEKTIGVVRRQGNYVEGGVNFLELRCTTTRSTCMRNSLGCEKHNRTQGARGTEGGHTTQGVWTVRNFISWVSVFVFTSRRANAETTPW